MALALAFTAACSKKKAPMPQPFGDELAAPQQSGAPLDPAQGGPGSTLLGHEGEGFRPASAGVSAEDVLRTVHFDYDRSDIRTDQRRVLDGNCEYLKANPQVRIIIEGHCDERGTVPYNFALGDRRTQEVKRYLVTMGIDPNRIATISKGEEQPLASGHTEAAWSQNRRAEFRIQ